MQDKAYPCGMHCDCAVCEFERRVKTLANENYRGLMTPVEYAERLLMVSAEFLESQTQQTGGN